MKFFFLLALISSSEAAVRWTTSTGAPLHRTDFANIQFSVNAATAQALGGDSAVAAIQAALTSWNAIPFTSLHFAPLVVGSAGIANDGLNVISFGDTADAIAATVPYGFADGRVVETDIMLNPNVKYSTTHEPGAYDLQSVVTHELGHALGANHATSLSSTMFWLSGQQTTVWSQLKPDDAAFAAEAYPGPGADSAYGKLTGTITKNGAPLLGAGILATDSATGICVGGISSVTNGTYSLLLPPGNYRVYAAPITPFTPPSYLYGLAAAQIDTGFQPTAAGTVPITGGMTASADISAPGGSSAIGIAEIGKVTNRAASWSTTALELPPGQPAEVILFGPGLDASLTEQNFAFIGPGIALRAGSLRVDPQLKDAAGLSALRFTIDVAWRMAPASASLFITKGANTALLAGGIAILSGQTGFHLRRHR